MYNRLPPLLKQYCHVLIYSIAAPILCASFIWAARSLPGFAQWYASSFFQIFPETFGRLFSPFPFSVLEIGIYLLILFLSVGTLCLAESLFTKTGRKKLICNLPKLFIWAACFFSTVFLMLTLACSINYSRDGIAEDIGIIASPSSQEDLIELCILLIGDLSTITESPGFTGRLSRAQLHRETKAAMNGLGEKHPSLKGYYPNPKPVLLSSYMSAINLTGLFSPYTMEANYNDDVVEYLKPFTICHELAHLRGYIKEDEAGFIAYLACLNSDSAELNYSGSLNALNYCLNALYRDSSREVYEGILAQIPEKAMDDLIKNQQYWNAHRSKASEISSAVNDKYLKANAQADGVKSYGRMVDLLLSYYKLNSEPV